MMSESGAWRAWDGLDGVLYQFKASSDIGYTLLVTNLSELYSETMSAADSAERLRMLNPSLEASFGQVVPYLVAAVGSADARPAWGGDVVSLASRAGGIPLRWQFHVSSCGDGDSGQLLVRPLLAALGRASALRCRLLAEVVARDRELDDYRRSGAHLTLPRLCTQPLDETRFVAEARAEGQWPEQLVDASAWKMVEREAAAAAAATTDKTRAPAEKQAPPVDHGVDVEALAERRRRELKERLQEEAMQEETAKNRKRKKLNL